METETMCDSFWELITTDNIAMEKEIEKESLRRVRQSVGCPFVKKIQQVNSGSTDNEVNDISNSSNRKPPRSLKPRRSSTPVDTCEGKKVKFSGSLLESQSADPTTKQTDPATRRNTDMNATMGSVLKDMNEKAKPVKHNLTVEFNEKLNLILNETMNESDKRGDATLTQDNANCITMDMNKSSTDTNQTETTDDVQSQNTKAKLKFRWKAIKGLPGHILVVHLRLPESQNLVALKWQKEKQVFESEHHDVVCGQHKCTMILAGRELEVEPLDIKFYTFECDVFLLDKEEARLYHERKILTEEAQGKQKSSTSDKAQKEEVDSSKERQPMKSSSNIDLEPRYEPRYKEDSLNVNTNTRSKSKDSTKSGPLKRSNSEDLPPSHSEDGLDLPKFKVPPKFTKFSANSKQANMDNQGMENEVKSENSKSGSGIRRSRVYEKLLKEQLKTKKTKEEDNDTVLRNDNARRETKHDEHQNEGKSRLSNGLSRDYDRNSRQESKLNRNGLSHSSDHTLSHPNAEKDRAYRSNDNLIDNRREPGRYSTKHLNGDFSSESNDRYASDNENIRSRSRPNKESGYASDTGAIRERYTRLVGSKSEYRESNNRYHSDGESRSNSLVRRDEQSRDDSGRKEVQRFDRDHERETQPHIRAPLRTGRNVPMPGRISRDQDTEKTRDERMQDLEDTVLSLKRVLNERERELGEYQAKNRALESDMSRNGQDRNINIARVESREETDKRVNELIREKENMATEIWRLKRDLEGQGLKSRGHTDSESDAHGHIESYDPDHPHVLKRKLDGYKPDNKKYYDDLESQLHDLQEVNETTASSLVRAEKEIEQLKIENQSLRKGGSSVGLGSTDYLRRETEQLRDDLRALRDKNHQLVQDNIKLTEHLKDLDAQGSSSFKGGRDDDSEVRVRCARYRKEREAALDEVEFLRKQLHAQRRDESMSRMRSKDYKSESNLLKEDTYRNPSQRQPSYISSTRQHVNGYPDESKRRERNHSGSDVSDSTAVLTSMAPNGFKNQRHLTDSQAATAGHKYSSHKLETNNNQHQTVDRYDDVGMTKTNNRGHSAAIYCDVVIDDVMDEMAHTSAPNVSNIVEDEIDSDNESNAIQNSTRLSNSHTQFQAVLKSSQVSKRIASHELQSTPISHQESKIIDNIIHVNNKSNIKSHQSFVPSNMLGTSERYDSIAISTSTSAKLEPLSKNSKIVKEVTSHNSSWCIDELSDVEDSVSCVGMRNAVETQSTNQRQAVSSTQHFKTIEPPEYASNYQQLRRTNSAGSDSTDLILGDAEQLVTHLTHPVRDVKGTYKQHHVKEYSMSMHNLSTASNIEKRKETKHHRNIPSPANERMPSPPPSEVLSSTLRSCSPRPTTTQHNKHLLSQSMEDTSFIASKRPFCPRSPGDMNMGDIVKFSRQGGKISRGTVKYVGRLPGKHDTYLGVELEHEMAKHDGVYENTRYFQCKSNKGVFVAFSKVVMAWGN